MNSERKCDKTINITNMTNVLNGWPNVLCFIQFSAEENRE